MAVVNISMAFFPNGGYFVGTPHHFNSSRLPESLKAGLHHTGRWPIWVEAGGNHGWFLRYREKQTGHYCNDWHGIPKHLVEVITPKSHAEQMHVKRISLGTGGHYFYQSSYGGWSYSSCPVVKERIDRWSGNGKLHFAALGRPGCAVAVYDNFRTWTSIPQSLADAFKSHKSSIRFITLSSYNINHYFVQFEDNSIAYCVPQNCLDDLAQLKAAERHDRRRAIAARQHPHHRHQHSFLEDLADEAESQLEKFIIGTAVSAVMTGCVIM